MTKDQLRIIFLGTPEFAVTSLDRILSEGFNVVGVVSTPDKPMRRGHSLVPSPVAQYALDHNLPLSRPEKLRDPEFIDWLHSLNANLFVVIAFRMLPEMVWTMPELGTFNLHASLLPRYRGAAPINHAVMNGDTETGVTTFFLKHEIDTGDVIIRRSITIGEDENVGSVHERLMNLGAEVTVDTLNQILAGQVNAIPQDTLAAELTPCPAPKIFKDTCQIDWTKTARQIHNHVRGLSPYPGAWSELRADNAAPGELKIYRTQVVAEPTDTALQPGEMLVTPDFRCLVGTGDGLIELLEVQPAGKRRMAVADYLRGARLQHPRLSQA